MKKSLYSLQDGIKASLKDLNDNEVIESTEKYAGVKKIKNIFINVLKEDHMIFITSTL